MVDFVRMSIYDELGVKGPGLLNEEVLWGGGVSEFELYFKRIKLTRLCCREYE